MAVSCGGEDAEHSKLRSGVKTTHSGKAFTTTLRGTVCAQMRGQQSGRKPQPLLLSDVEGPSR